MHLIVRLQLGEYVLEELSDEVLEELLFAFEVEIEGALRDPRAAGDLFDARTLEADLAEDLTA
jgi:hypothetical protein